ncbi:protein kinase [Sansalvadorimonas sp. 2012CJ34-2]|uniref:non-specific serine/threonine protein kinase n=1 Tax=Parendozoicomonas callyspongiae TaxID=2942213 RepID=A0ABT0PGR3_9GAMM|nr:protein kinase [Sansalvadorimonas sp. 2012CJ34-2]MCL6270441.1 protein kinase [Sansalvadorimonas sp. 2012CJ34-2]
MGLENHNSGKNKLPAMIFAGLVLFSTFAVGNEDTSNRLVTVTPAGTYIHTRSGIFQLQDIQLPAVIVNTLIQAGTSIASRRIIQTLMTYAMAYSGQAMGYGWQQWLLQQYENGSLTSAMQGWHWLLLGWRGLKISSALYSELLIRSQNMAGTKRYGVMPLYPGEALDQSVFIDFHLLKSGNFITVVPLDRVDTAKLTDPWQLAIAQLVNRAVELDVDQIKLKQESDNGVLFLWHLRDGEWNSAKLFEAEHQLLMEYLTDSYRQTASESDLSSVLEAGVLHCLSEKLLNQEVICQSPSGIKAQLKPNKENCFTLDPTSTSLLCLENNQSWSPGLPGALAYATSQQYSGQFRVPLWISRIMETLLYQLAVYLLEKPVDDALESMSRWWHQVDTYSPTEVIRADGWIPERDDNNQARYVRRWSRVERVQDQNGKSWIKKSASWYDQGEKGKWHDAYPILAREAHTVSHLNHPNIVTIQDSWIEDAGSPEARIVMLQEDAGLSLDKVAITSMEQVKNIVRSVVQGLSFSHQQGYVHFDITPSNIMINEKRQVRIGDYGVAGDLSQAGEAIFSGGTNGYIAPELEVGKPASWKSDIWSLGSLTRYLLDRLPEPERGDVQSSAVNNFMRATGDDWLSNSSYEELLQHPFLQLSGPSSTSFQQL